MRVTSFAITMMIFLGSTDAWADFSFGTRVIPTTVEYRFRSWMLEYEKNYASKEEYAFRLAAFSKSYAEIEYNNLHMSSTH